MSLPGLLAPRVRVLFDPQKLDGADSYAVETCWNYEEEECLWRWRWRQWQWWLIMMMSMTIMYLLTAYSQFKNKLHDGIIVTGAVSPWGLFLGICKSDIIPKQPGLTFCPFMKHQETEKLNLRPASIRMVMKSFRTFIKALLVYVGDYTTQLYMSWYFRTFYFRILINRPVDTNYDMSWLWLLLYAQVDGQSGSRSVNTTPRKKLEAWLLLLGKCWRSFPLKLLNVLNHFIHSIFIAVWYLELWMSCGPNFAVRIV